MQAWIRGEYARARDATLENLARQDRTVSLADVEAEMLRQFLNRPGHPYLTAPQRTYMHSNLANLLVRIGARRTHLRTVQRQRDIDRARGVGIRSANRTLRNHEETVQEIADGFDIVPNAPQHGNVPNRRVITIRNAGYQENLARVEDFWEGLIVRIRSILEEEGQPPDRWINIMVSTPEGNHSINIRHDGRSGPNSAQHFTLNDLTVTALNRVIEALSQSERNIQLRDLTFQIVFYTNNQQPVIAQHGRNRRGGGSIRGHGIKDCPKGLEFFKNRLQWFDRKGGLCGLKVLVAGMDDVLRKEEERTSRTDLSKSRPSIEKKLLEKARILREDLGLASDRDYTTLDDFAEFVTVYPDWRVVCLDEFGNQVGQGVWTGADFKVPEEEDEEERPIFGGRTIYVFHVKDHFARIPNDFASNFRTTDEDRTIDANGSRTKTCSRCLKSFSRKTFNRHKCPGRCFCRECHKWMSEEKFENHRVQENVTAKLFVCAKCGCKCGSQECLNMHYLKCEGTRPHCHYCKVVFDEEDTAELHKCKTLRCHNTACRQKMDKWDLLIHRCYMAPKSQRKKKRNNKRTVDDVLEEEEALEFEDDEDEEEEEEEEEKEEEEEEGRISDLTAHWAWDIETKNVETANGQTQVPNYIVAVNLADPHNIIETETMADFITEMTREAQRKKTRFTCWAHNGAKFDTRFVYDYVRGNLGDDGQNLIKITSRHPGTIFVGNKLFELVLTNITFRDSYLHLPMKLADLPSALDLDTAEICEMLGVDELKKGMFPYSFNTQKNQTYSGPLPDLTFYKPDDRPPRDPYKPREDDKEGVIQWWHEEKARRELSGEPWVLQKELRDYCIVDTLILQQALVEWQRLNLEMGNCDPLESLTLPGHAHNTFRTKYLKPKTIPILRTYPGFAQPNDFRDKNLLAFDEEDLCRRAYLGGNTNCRRMILELTEEQIAAGHKINMYDFRSQYPSCMTGDHVYPIGNYEFFSYYPADDSMFELNYPGDQYRPESEPVNPFQPTDEDIFAMHGVICCEIYYPNTEPPMFHPILPSVRNGKLTFSLEMPERTLDDIRHWEFHACKKPDCSSCKKFIGVQLPVYTLVEVQEARRNNYEILHVYWILGTKKVSKDLFKDYVAQNYGLKARSSKAPNYAWGDPDAEKKYVEEHEKVGITVEPAEGETSVKSWHVENGGKKALGKLMANSGYGKFGEKGYRTQTLLAKNQDSEMAIWYRADTQEIEITSRNFFNDLAEYRVRNKTPGSNITTTNVLLAAYVTAYGRLMLWKLCNQFGKDVLYHDTDSAIIHIRPGVVPPPVGVFLGELEEEITGAHSFVSTGPKSYAIKYWDKPAKLHFELLGKSLDQLRDMPEWQRDRLLLQVGEGSFRWLNDDLQFEHVKQRSKGIVLTAYNSRILNYESMRYAVLDMIDGGTGRIHIEGLKSLDFVWKRDALEFYIKEGHKTVRAEASILKGDLKNEYLMPFGWRRWPIEAWGDLDSSISVST